jgi:hypothetical protein
MNPAVLSRRGAKAIGVRKKNFSAFICLGAVALEIKEYCR